MELDNIFNQIKTQGYIADKKYNVGDISEKTGLQKQPDGSWKPVKGAAKQNTKHQDGDKVNMKNDFPEHFKAGYADMSKAEMEKKFDEAPKRYTFSKGGHHYEVPAESAEQAVKLLNERGVRGIKAKDAVETIKGQSNRRPAGVAKNEKVANNGNMENKENAANKTKKLKVPDENSSFQTDVNRMKALKKEDYKQYTIQLEKLHSKYPINKWKQLYNKTL